ncbi:MAG: ribonuclease P protein component [Dehalococcoidia bacterium]|nr:ribonuclease P protein component [Dehalococcoidia bacterium]
MTRQWSLTTGEQFTAVFRRGRACYGTLVAVRVLHNCLGLSRLGLVVGKKVGDAVERNRVKRRIRHIVGIRVLPPGWDLVVIARPGIQSAQYRDVERELRQLLERAGVLSAHSADDGRPDTVVPENHL